MVVYTDGSMLEGSKVGVGLYVYYDEHLQDKRWNLGGKIEVFVAELFAFEQVLHLAKTWASQ